MVLHVCFCFLSLYVKIQLICYLFKFGKFYFILGTHELSVEYGGQTIPGSPLVTEIFDPSKILLEGVKRCKVGELLVVDGKPLYLDLFTLQQTT